MGRRTGRASRHRDPEHLVRREPVPRPLQAPGRGREARRPAGGRFPAGTPAISLSEPIVKPTTMLYRNLLAIEAEELLRSHPVDGAVLMGGLRQDHAGADHGRGLDGSALRLPARRPDAAGQLEGADAGIRIGRLEVLGRAPGRQHHRRRLAGYRGRHRALLWPLHDHGDGIDHDRDCRGAGPDLARPPPRSRRPTPTTSACRRPAGAARSRWFART